ncbi:MAG: ferrous iron transport protein B [Fusobacteria bacterium]|nr:ferrous iron transport protein B [Fusobacteriota bacterium]
MKRQISIALIGNPNCGKTTLFNALTGARQHVGNWPGVTVEKKVGNFSYKEFDIELIDLPGIYGFSTNSLDEVVSKNYLLEEKPDLIINVVDATTLEKSLQLTTQLIEMNQKIILVFNMWDEVEKRDIQMNIPLMEKLLAAPIIKSVAKKSNGKQELLAILAGSLDLPWKHKIVPYDLHVEESISKISEQLGENYLASKRWVSVKLLEGDSQIREKIAISQELNEIVELEAKKLKSKHQQEVSFLISDSRYGFINGVLSECIESKGLDKMILTAVLDRLLLNKWLGFPLFFVCLWLIFYLTFTIGDIVQNWIASGVDILANALNYLLPTGALQDLLVNGILNAVGNILSFLPQIVLLFLMLSIMEDSGYMSRVAFLMDKLMHFIGIHGKSFISLFSSLGCNVPGIMASRIVESEDDRKITILINSFIPCSGRFAIYIVLVGLFFPHGAYNVIFAMYIIGIVVAIVTAKILKKFIFKKNSDPSVMELPPYRIPTLKSVLLHMWDRASMFIKKMSTVIVIGTIIVWALGYFPTHTPITPQITHVQSQISTTTGSVQKGYELQLQELQKGARINNSYLADIGHIMQPGLEPLGFSWREGVSLISGFIAKEIFISSMIVIYGVSGGAANLAGLKEGLIHLSNMDSLKMFSLLVFVTLYVPCVATIAAIKREMNSQKWMWFSIFYGIGIAYFVSFVIYQIGRLFFR